MTNGNGTTARWIAIIAMVIITMASLAFGVIRNSNTDRLDRIQRQVNRHEELIAEMRTATAESRARTDEQIKSIQTQLGQLNKKMDILLERLK